MTSNQLLAVAARHCANPTAFVADLMTALLPAPGEVPPLHVGKSEAFSSSLIRIEAGARGVLLMRNNVGALMNERGVPVRYGLMNESAQLNKRLKSADMIGIERVTITPQMVGTVVGRFFSVEAKKPDWRPGEDKAREDAQKEWALLVTSWGGRAVIARGPHEVW